MARLAQARPRLSTVAPLTVAIVRGFVALNFLIGLAFLQIPPGSLSVVTQTLTGTRWGIIFFVLGGLLALGLKINSWNLVKRILIAGLFFKIIVEYSLVVLLIQGHLQTIGTFGIWTFIAYVQAMVVVHFLENYNVD